MNKDDILNKEVNEEDLKSVNGGGAFGPGGCDKDYYEKNCVATVEKGSWCGSNDFCIVVQCIYTPNDPS